MRAKFVNEKFKEGSDPIKDMNIGTEGGYVLGSDEHKAYKLANEALKKSKFVVKAIKKYDAFYNSNSYMTSSEKKDYEHKLGLVVAKKYKEYNQIKDRLLDHIYEIHNYISGIVKDEEKDKIYSKIMRDMYKKNKIPSNISRIGFWSNIDELQSAQGK